MVEAQSTGSKKMKLLETKRTEPTAQSNSGSGGKQTIEDINQIILEKLNQLESTHKPASSVGGSGADSTDDASIKGGKSDQS